MDYYGFALVLTLVLRPSIVAAHGSVDGMAGNMLPYLHFTSGDNMWFLGWVPKSAGAMVGTCIGLFMLGLIDRWISACASVIGSYWDKQAQVPQFDPHRIVIPKSDPKNGTSSSTNSTATHYLFPAPPLILHHDFPRGVIHAAVSALQFSLMLVIMTYNIGFIFSVLMGLGVGEMLFGRFAMH